MDSTSTDTEFMWYSGRLRCAFGDIPAFTLVAYRFLRRSPALGRLWVFKAKGYPRIRQVSESAYGAGVAQLIYGKLLLPPDVQTEANARLRSWQKRQDLLKHPRKVRKN